MSNTTISTNQSTVSGRMLTNESVYRSVRAALESVIARGDSETTVKSLRECLEREGWSRMNSLEDHWLYKQQSAYLFHFITPTGGI